MPVMQIGKVGMGMPEFFVPVEMNMSSVSKGAYMFMPVVSVIMAVPMDVLCFGVSVRMGMFLKNDGYNRYRQNKGCANLNP